MQVDEVRQTLGSAVQDADRAVNLLRTVRELAESAAQATEFVRRTSIDPIGISAIRQFIEDIDKLFPLAARYVEDTNTYINTLG